MREGGHQTLREVQAGACNCCQGSHFTAARVDDWTILSLSHAHTTHLYNDSDSKL